MTYEIYRYIFLGGAILAGIMFAVSVLVFFLLKIPTVIGDLTGANARKAIENIRNQNESTGARLTVKEVSLQIRFLLPEGSSKIRPTPCMERWELKRLVPRSFTPRM